jgi:SAM-dependent methyltransferase
MAASSQPKISIGSAFRDWWKDNLSRQGILSSLRTFLAEMSRFLRDSTPSRRRQRYGDVGYDWDYRVDTTSATVGWRDRLLGLLHSPYQPTEPALFHEMLSSLHLDHREFTFIDLGSGKGRALLMAAEYPFRRILGVELLPQLNRIAQENLRKYKSGKQKSFNLKAACGDACTFVFPPEPTVLYLFNPLPESGLKQVLGNLEQSLDECSRQVYVLYHDPLLEHVLSQSAWLQKIGGTHQYCVYASGDIALR